MQKNLEMKLHSGNLPDPRKNPEKWEKLRVRTAKLETKLNVMQRDSVAQMVELLSPGQLSLAAVHMDTTDFATALKFMDADVRREFLAGVGLPIVLGHLRRMPPNKREDILKTLDDDMKLEAERLLSGNQRAEGQEYGRSNYYDVMSRFWTSLRQETPIEWSAGERMMNVIDSGERGKEGSVVRRIAETVTEIRAQEKMVVGKRARLEQLSISKRKQTIRRIRLLRSGGTPSKMEQASEMTGRLAASDANDRWRERREASRLQAGRLSRREQQFQITETNGTAVIEEVAAVETNDERELFGGLDNVPAELRKW